ncbi:MAG: amidohydrolase family protein [Rhodospirillales bacterium]|jgi:aminocarboxymuconate-semialdehyde decarboxylase
MSEPSGVEFVGCDLHYHADKPAFEKNPSTIECQTPRPVTVNGKRMLTIDVHAHCQIADAWPLFKDRPEFKGKKNPFEHKTRSRVADIPTRLAEIDAMGIDMQALSVGTGHHFYWADYDLAVAHVKLQNEKVAEICENYPDRFVGFAIAALQHPDLAAEQLEYAVKKLNLRGAIVNTNINGDELSDPKFAPFWAKAEELDAVIFLHPSHFPEAGERLEGRGHLQNIIGNPLDTSIALAHMIYDGTLDAYSGLKIVAAHGGGLLPSYIGRYDHGHNSNDRGGRGEEKKKPSDYLKQLYFDTLVFGTENLRHLINECGVSQMVMGTDHPAGMANINPIAHILSTPGLSDDDLEAILGGTLQKILKIER